MYEHSARIGRQENLVKDFLFPLERFAGRDIKLSIRVVVSAVILRPDTVFFRFSCSNGLVIKGLSITVTIV